MKLSKLIILFMISSTIIGCANRIATQPAPRTISTYTTSKSQKIYFCPKPQVIVKHKRMVEGFNDQKLNWSLNNQGWKMPKHISFMQAIIGESANNLVCYYQWPNPKAPGTNHWTTVDLNPDVNQKIFPYGVHWKATTPDINICHSGNVKTCGFTLR